MSTYRHLLLGLLLALAGVAPIVGGAAPAAAQENGRIEGRVANGTAGGPVPVDAPVTLHILKDRAKAGEQRLKTDAEGRFVADGLATGPSYVYFPIVEYGGAIYYPDRPIVLDDAAPRETEITVYEPSRTSDGLAFERSNMLVMAVTPTMMTVMEMGAVVNRTDTTFVGDDSGRTLRLVLPPGATNVAPQTGLPPDTLEALPDGFATDDPIRPGRRELAFSYQLPFDSSTLDVTRRPSLPIDTFTLYLPETGVGVTSTALRLQGTAELGGQRYQQFVAQNVPAGAELQFRLTGLPAPFSLKPRELGMVVAGIGALGLAIALFVALRRRAGRSAAAPVVAPAPLAAEDAERLRLVRALADLDERFAAGEIDEAAYRAEREREKGRLVALLASGASAGSSLASSQPTR